MISDRSSVALIAGIFLFALASISLAACHSAEPLQQRSENVGESAEHTESNAYSAEEPPRIEAGLAPPPGPYAPGFDAIHYDIAISLPDTGTFISGRTAAHVLVDEPRSDTLSLDFSGLAVSSVEENGQILPFEHRDGKIRIPVPAGIASGDTLRVQIAYHGRPDDGLILGTNIHGDPTAFADNWPNRARFWFPSIDHPSDKATVSFTVETAPGRQVVSNGVLVSDDEDSGIWRWENPEPIPTYTMVIGAANFFVERLDADCEGSAEECPEVTTWLFPQDTAAASHSFRRAGDMVTYYSRLIGPFPYRKLAHVQSSTVFGGMENVTAIFYPQEALAAGNDIEVTVAHETAHQWFGNAVTESDWNHLWLSEGFASYFAALFFEEMDGTDRFRAIMDDYRTGYLLSETVGTPIVATEQESLFALLNANNYYKSAWVLHMLRVRLGEQMFFDGIRDYYARFEHDTALTDDLRQSFESVSGDDLQPFFDRWVFAPGHPQFTIEWSWDATTEGVHVQIDQVQPEEWIIYEGPIVLELATDGGVVEMHAELSGRRTSIDFPLASEPTSLEADPNGDVLAEFIDVRQVAH